MTNERPEQDKNKKDSNEIIVAKITAVQAVLVAFITVGGSVAVGFMGYRTGVNQTLSRNASDNASPCRSMQGAWEYRGEKFELTQSQCIVSGYLSSDIAPNAHEIHAAITGSKAIGYVRRVFKGCSTILGVEYELISETRLLVKVRGYGCGLPNDYFVELTYVKAS
jgi:hypothetical protein